MTRFLLTSMLLSSIGCHVAAPNDLVVDAPGASGLAATTAAGTVAPSPRHRPSAPSAPGNASDPGHRIGGNVTGLHGNLKLTDRGGTPLMIGKDGAFWMPSDRRSGEAYDVRVVAQPAGQHCWVADGADRVYDADVTAVAITCSDVHCVNLGWKRGGADWTCPAGKHLPQVGEEALVEPCVDPADRGRFSSHADVAMSVGGCGCGWNGAYCDEPSVTTLNGTQACGDYPQLHVCVGG